MATPQPEPDPTSTDNPGLPALLSLHDWDELVFGGFYCLHCTPEDAEAFDEAPVAWPCQPLRDAGLTNEQAIDVIERFRALAATVRTNGGAR
jgi:hypothetical protein